MVIHCKKVSKLVWVETLFERHAYRTDFYFTRKILKRSEDKHRNETKRVRCSKSSLVIVCFFKFGYLFQAKPLAENKLVFK